MIWDDHDQHRRVGFHSFYSIKRCGQTLPIVCSDNRTERIRKEIHLGKQIEFLFEQIETNEEFHE